MKVEFVLDKHDLVDFSMHYSEQSTTLRPLKIITTVMMVLLGVAGSLLFALRLDVPLLFTLCVFLMCSIIVCPLIIFMSKRVLKHTTKFITSRLLSESPKNACLGRCEITISKDAILGNSADSRSTLSWRAIDKITVTDTTAYLHIGPGTAVIIPKRAFATEAEFTAFVEQAKQYKKQAEEAGAAANGPIDENTDDTNN